MASPLLALLLLCLSAVSGHETHRSECPPATKPMVDFDASRFSGVWYAVRSFDPHSSCLTFTYTACGAGEGCSLTVRETKQLNVPRTSTVYSTTGKLTVANVSDPARMKADFVSNLGADALYTILDTDYTRYAIVYTCQNFPLKLHHRRDVYTLVRDVSAAAGLEQEVTQLRSAVLEANVIENESKEVSHENCVSADEANLDIDASKFKDKVADAAKKVAGVASKAADGVKSIFSAISGLFGGGDPEPAAAGVSPLAETYDAVVTPLVP